MRVGRAAEQARVPVFTPIAIALRITRAACIYTLSIDASRLGAEGLTIDLSQAFEFAPTFGLLPRERSAFQAVPAIFMCLARPGTVLVDEEQTPR